MAVGGSGGWVLALTGCWDNGAAPLLLSILIYGRHVEKFRSFNFGIWLQMNLMTWKWPPTDFDFAF